LTLRLPIAPRTLTRLLALTVAALAAAGVALQYLKHIRGHDHVFGLVRLFDLDRESNVPTWYASAALLLAGLLVAGVAGEKRRAADPFARHWTGLAAILVYLSCDEGAALHEHLILPIQQGLGLDGVFYFAWVVVGIPVAGLVAIAYARFLRSLPRPTARLIALAGALYVAGAIGLEMVGAWWWDRHGGGDRFAYALITAVEETLEMAGVVVFIHAIAAYAAGPGGDAAAAEARPAGALGRSRPGAPLPAGAPGG